MVPTFLSSQINASIDIVGSYDFINSVYPSQRFESINLDQKRKNEVQRSNNYRVGINANFRVLERVYLKTGLRYSKYGYLARSYVDFVEDANGFTFNHYYVYYDETYIEMPVVFRYEFSNAKHSFYMEFGISPHLYLKGFRTIDHETLEFNSEYEAWESSDNETIYDSSMEYEIPYLKGSRFRLAYNFGVGWNYNLSKKNQLFFQPTMRLYRGLANSNNLPSNEIVTGIINVGIEFGIRRALSFEKP